MKVRIAVAVDADGDWSAVGSRGLSDEKSAGYAADTVSDPYHVRFVEADVPLPDTSTIEGEVKP